MASSLFFFSFSGFSLSEGKREIRKKKRERETLGLGCRLSLFIGFLPYPWVSPRCPLFLFSFLLLKEEKEKQKNKPDLFGAWAVPMTFFFSCKTFRQFDSVATRPGVTSTWKLFTCACAQKFASFFAMNAWLPQASSFLPLSISHFLLTSLSPFVFAFNSFGEKKKKERAINKGTVTSGSSTFLRPLFFSNFLFFFFSFSFSLREREKKKKERKKKLKRKKPTPYRALNRSVKEKEEEDFFSFFFLSLPESAADYPHSFFWTAFNPWRFHFFFFVVCCVVILTKSVTLLPWYCKTISLFFSFWKRKREKGLSCIQVCCLQIGSLFFCRCYPFSLQFFWPTRTKTLCLLLSLSLSLFFFEREREKREKSPE